MRAAVIVVLMSVLAAPSEASDSCMTKSEARRHFASVHIYWHGRDHCWDATPGRRHHQVPKVQLENVHREIAWPRWQTAMSELLPDEEPVQAPLLSRSVDIEPSPLVARWVEITQVVPPPIIESEPIVPLRGVLMVIIIIIGLPLAIVGVLFGGRRSKLDTLNVFRISYRRHGAGGLGGNGLLSFQRQGELKGRRLEAHSRRPKSVRCALR